jgi:hypothetical protein
VEDIIRSAPLYAQVKEVKIIIKASFDASSNAA